MIPEIIHIENNFACRKVVEFGLSKLEKKIIQFDNGKDGLEYFKKNSDDIKLILTEIRLPIFSGYELIKEIRACGYQVPIISISSIVSKKNILELLNIGCNEHITKPVSIHLLRKTVLNYME